MIGTQDFLSMPLPRQAQQITPRPPAQYVSLPLRRKLGTKSLATRMEKYDEQYSSPSNQEVRKDFAFTIDSSTKVKSYMGTC